MAEEGQIGTEVRLKSWPVVMGRIYGSCVAGSFGMLLKLHSQHAEGTVWISVAFEGSQELWLECPMLANVINSG